MWASDATALRRTDQVQPALSGWLGHDAPFAFETGYRPAAGIERMRVGTPPVIQMTALEHALGLWRKLFFLLFRNDLLDLFSGRWDIQRRLL